MKHLAVSTVALALMTVPVSAQVIRLKCEYADGNPPPKLITVDYGAKTLTYQDLDKAGNITPGWDGLANLPATITSDSISARSRRQCGMFAATLNRRSGILVVDFCDGHLISKVCEPYTAGPQRF